MNYKLRNNYSKDADIALEELLTDRGVTNIDDFIHPTSECENDPYLLDNIRDGAGMLLKHLKKDSKILFIVDCDADGFTSSSILWIYIKNFFPEAKLDFTVHEHKQHGLADKIDWIVNENYYDLVICPDSASYDVDAHRQLMECGIECLILDHHEQLYDEKGNAIISNYKNTIVINNQLSKNYPNKSLCGAGVTYKFCEVLDDLIENSGRYSQRLIDLVAIGEIADVMNKTDTETNYLIEKGLGNINNEGIVQLLHSQAYSLKGKSEFPYIGLTSEDIGFYIGPLINAVTRVGTISEKELMFTAFVEPNKKVPATGKAAKTKDYEKAAEQLCRIISLIRNKQNKIKDQAIEKIIFKIQKEELYNNNVLFVEIDEDDDIPQELSGLIAMAMVNKYNRPCMIARRNEEGLLQGSFRCGNNYAGLSDFKKWLEDSGLVEYAAGHARAAGYGIKETNLDKFIAYGNENLSSKDFEQCYLVDYEFNANDPSLTKIANAFASHPEYFGNGIDKVKFVVKNIKMSSFMLMGTNKDSVKINNNKISYVKFKDQNFADEVCDNKDCLIDVYGEFSINAWNGTKSLQCIIQDYEIKKDESIYDF